MDIDNICIILTGYAISTAQLLTEINYYWNKGFRKIIISSYSQFDVFPQLSSEQQQAIKLIYNDLIKDKKCPIVSGSTKDKRSSGLKIALYQPCFPFTDSMSINLLHENNFTRLKIINFQLTTFKRALDCLQLNFPDTKWIFRTRIDIRVPRIKEKILEWINKITNDSKEPTNNYQIYNHKLICQSLKHYSYTFPFYICDYWLFGHVQDVSQHYQIPLITNVKQLITSPRDKIQYRFIVEQYLSSQNILSRLGLDRQNLSSEQARSIIDANFIFNVESMEILRFKPETLKLLGVKPDSDYMKFMTDNLDK